MNIVYCTDHKYMFLCCVSIYSLMEHIAPGESVQLHLLVNESFCEEDERLLDFLKESFPGLEVTIHTVEKKLFEGRDYTNAQWSKVIFYRLILPKLLVDVDICLYLDSDTLVTGDICPVFKTDMRDFYLAGVFEDISAVRKGSTLAEYPIDTYINSGVLLMNLELMRRDGIQDALMGADLNLMVPDQDILNIICHGRIKLLPPGYNYILGTQTEVERFGQSGGGALSVPARALMSETACGEGEKLPEGRVFVKIRHFLLQDYIRPWRNLRADGADQWWDTANRFAKVFDLEALRQKADWYDRGSISAIYRKCADYEDVYVVGDGDDAKRLHRALRLGKCRGLKSIVHEKDVIPYDENSLVIVASGRRNIHALQDFMLHQADHPETSLTQSSFTQSQAPASDQRLLSSAIDAPGEGKELTRSADGAGKDQILRYARWPVSYYNNSVCEELSRNLEAELLMWEYGVDERGMDTPGALLELNAVRSPGKEALSEYRQGGRTSITYGELNREANRLTHYLRQEKIPRGARVRIRPEDTNLSDFLAAALGIMKGGCVVWLDGTEEKSRRSPQVFPGSSHISESDVLSVDTSILRDERICCRAPASGALPYEPALLAGGEILTGRNLVKLSETVRRRCGWHRQDRMLLCPGNKYGGLIEILASFAAGTTAYLISGEDTGALTDILKDEQISLMRIPGGVFEHITESFDRKAAGREESILPGEREPSGAFVWQSLNELRLVLTDEDEAVELSAARRRWFENLPHIPVNGLGYAGRFEYVCRWY